MHSMTQDSPLVIGTVDAHADTHHVAALVRPTRRDVRQRHVPDDHVPQPPEPFVRLGRTIRKHRDGILAARRLKLSNARAEALNNKVKLIVRRAYGFHSANAALALVHLTCGPVTSTLLHEHPFA